MIKNYFITTFRNIKKTKLFSFINIFGLAIGMVSCLLILYYVTFEKSYDKFYPNSDRVYRLRYERGDQDGQVARFASCCPPAGLRIRQLYPEVEKIGRIFRYRASVSYSENKFIEEKMFFAEPEFLEIFKFKFIDGNPSFGIKEPNKAFISRTTAHKYFGEENPIGKTISVDKKADYAVIGIFEDVPQNSHVKPDILLSYPNILNLYGPDVEDSWGDTGWFTYLLLKQGVNPQEFEEKLQGLVEKEFGQVLREYKLTLDLKLQPLNDIHLTSHFMQEFEANGDRDTVNFLSIIAVFIIIIAWVNYVNLSTVHSLTRAKEIGLRKVVGASRKQLIMQFFFETIVVNVIAIVLAIGLLMVLLPSFCQLTGTPTDYSIWNQEWFWITLLIMFLAGVFLAGLYPVLALSAFKPIEVLKGKLGNKAKGFSLRKALVVFQYMIAFVLITGTVAVFKQLSFMKNQDIGFSIDQKLVIRAPRVRDASFGSKLKTFKEQLLSKSDIQKFCVVTEVPGKQVLWDAGGICREGTNDNKNYQIVGIDYDFADLFELKFACGRNFSKEFPADSNSLILNETASRWLGFKTPEEAIDQKINYWDKIYLVAGVLKDYHQQSLKAEFEPHIYRFMPVGRDVRGMFVIKTNSNRMSSLIQDIKKRYDEFFPGNPFEYFFLDEYYNQQYKADELFGRVFGIFSFLAIFVTSLGIFGLSSFMVSQRTKEIGIRKVLGASMKGILFLLANNFLVLIIISFIFAVPISYFAIQNWLESFAARMDMTIDLFLIPLIVVSVITCLTICVRIIKAAASNPIESLRYE
jgi:putative ABC transport system permease protein